jgi:hypothetical protein
MPDIAGLSAEYSTTSALKCSLNDDSQLYTSQHVTAVVTVRALCPQLSPEMRSLIARLPRWSNKSQQQYYEFFSNHGTHVVLRLALGGNLRVVIRDLHDVRDQERGRGIRAEATAPALNEIGLSVGTTAHHLRNSGTRDARERRDISVFRDGGGSVSSELTSMLENHFKHAPSDHLSERSWPGAEVRRKWVKALEIDPTFCPDNEYTEYRWLHTLGGLTKYQENDLRMASESYLRMRHKKRPLQRQPTAERTTTHVDDLPRDQNSNGVLQTIRNLLPWNWKGSKQRHGIKHKTGRKYINGPKPLANVGEAGLPGGT